MSVTITTITTDEEITQLLDLQYKNLARNNSCQTIESQGFVTVEHTFELLKAMSDAAPQTIATDGDLVVGYALVMLKEFRQAIPMLEPMFLKLPHILYEDYPLSAHRYYIMGQICIAEAYRGQGLFDRLYQEQRNQLAGRFDLCVTEVANHNPRSMKAHVRVGFESVYEYVATSGKTWSVIVWDFRK